MSTVQARSQTVGIVVPPPKDTGSHSRVVLQAPRVPCSSSARPSNLSLVNCDGQFDATNGSRKKRHYLVTSTQRSCNVSLSIKLLAYDPQHPTPASSFWPNPSTASFSQSQSLTVHVITAVRALPDKTCAQHISKPSSVSSLHFSPAFLTSHC